MLRIIDDMSSDDNISNDDSSSDDRTISPMLEQSDSDSDTESVGVAFEDDDPTPGPSGDGDTGRRLPDSDSSVSDTDIHENNAIPGPSTSGSSSTIRSTGTSTRGGRGRARRSGGNPGPRRYRDDRSRSPARQPARGRGRTMARGRAPDRGRDPSWCGAFTPRQNTVEFTANVGPTFRRNQLPADVTPIDVFELFFDASVIDLFVEQTNLNHERKKAAEPNKHKSPWQPTSSREITLGFLWHRYCHGCCAVTDIAQLLATERMAISHAFICRNNAER